MSKDDEETSPILQKLISLLQKELVLTESKDAITVELTYSDGERVRFSLLQLDPPAGEVLN